VINSWFNRNETFALDSAGSSRRIGPALESLILHSTTFTLANSDDLADACAFGTAWLLHTCPPRVWRPALGLGTVPGFDTVCQLKRPPHCFSRARVSLRAATSRHGGTRGSISAVECVMAQQRIGWSNKINDNWRQVQIQVHNLPCHAIQAYNR
jgi:hypothetical protein